MTDEKYILITRTLKSQNVDYEQLPILLRHMIIAEYLRQEKDEKGYSAVNVNEKVSHNTHEG